MAKKRQALEAELGSLVRDFQRATDEVDEEVTRLMGVNRTDARCIDVLDQYGRMTAGELAAHTNLSSGAITGVLDRLERAGYVRRIRDEADRRRVLVEATERARSASQEYYGPLAEQSAPLIAAISDAELEAFVRFLRAGTELNRTHAAALRDRRPARRTSANTP